MEEGTKSLVNTGGSGLPLAHLLGGGIALVVRGTILDSELSFTVNTGLKKSYFKLEDVFF